MKMILSNGAAGGGPYSRVSYCARPERKGLYGKKPLAKISIAIGIRMFAAKRQVVEIRETISLLVVHSSKLRTTS
jgi:hypothetical protein